MFDVCDSCGKEYPTKRMQKRWEWEESTKAGGSWTYRGSGSSTTSKTNSSKGYNRKGGGISYNTGRTYYRKRHFFVCNGCIDREEKEAQERVEVIAAFFLLAGVIWAGMTVWDYVKNLFQ